MGRPVILGNGSLTVGLNEQGLVHDFYYPYVGLDNLTTSRSMHHKIGVWVDGVFSWTDADDWSISVDFEPNALVSIVTMINDTLHISLSMSDFVDHQYNAFCRQVIVKNLHDQSRQVRVFLHQVFQISRAGRGDTALFVPNENYMLDYKGRCSLLIFSQHADGTPFDQYAVGSYEIEGKTGTWCDAEDGELSGNPVEHGGIDSVISNLCELAPDSSSIIDYWVVAADSQFAAEHIHKNILDQGLSSRLAKTRTYWQKWLATSAKAISSMPSDRQILVQKSLMVIKAHTDKRGGIIASCDSSIYNFGRDYYSYVWPRDGAYAMWPLMRLGYVDEPKRFFEFCRDIMHDDGYMMHKYQPDKAIGSTWHPLIHGMHSEIAIQEDETASVLYMLSEFYKETKDKEYVLSLYTTLIKPMANFMADFRDHDTGLPHASYDLWEEKFLTSTYTTALVHRALVEAAVFADLFEYPDDGVRWRDAADSIAKNSAKLYDEESGAFVKGFLRQDDGTLFYDKTLDVSSAYGAMMFAAKPFGVSRVRKCFEVLEKELLGQSPAGGSPRYENDGYFASNPGYKGNTWFVTTLWFAQYYLQVDREEEADKLAVWTIDHAGPSGVLSEQVHPATGKPLSVMPLVWSHAELINTLLDIHS